MTITRKILEGIYVKEQRPTIPFVAFTAGLNSFRSLVVHGQLSIYESLSEGTRGFAS